LIKYQQLTGKGAGPLLTVGDLLDRYLAEVVPTKAPRTQIDNYKEIARLRIAFGGMLIGDVTEQLVYQYLDGRRSKNGDPAPVRANREIALLRHAYRKAIRWGSATRNPCLGIEYNRETPRDRDVSDQDLLQFLAGASPLIRGYAELKQLTGLRKGDLLLLRKSDLTEEGILVEPRKTRRLNPRTGLRKGRQRLIEWSPELSAAVDTVKRLWEGQRHVSSVYLFHTRKGAPYYNEAKSTADGFDSIWHRYMKKAEAKGVEHFTEHDIRAKAGSEAVRAGQDGPKLLGNSQAIFNKVYSRGVEKVQPLKRVK
jgi:integrase